MSSALIPTAIGGVVALIVYHEFSRTPVVTKIDAATDRAVDAIVKPVTSQRLGGHWAKRELADYASRLVDAGVLEAGAHASPVLSPGLKRRHGPYAIAGRWARTGHPALVSSPERAAELLREAEAGTK